jgi:signal transduction histidine kinase
MFILIGYLGFSYVKKGEHDSIWVGMSRETAHQLGTPLSSLMAWIEMLKYSSGDDPKRMEIVTDMENDLGRLQKVTDRFSKIGSKPSLKDENLGEVIGGAISYYRKRLPSKFGKEGSANIEIVLESGADIHARINKELFEWVIENLIKNALDAMEGKGRISFNISSEEGSVFIDVKDTGKGIDLRYKKDIFRPGYTTKARGWGLGLSLSKRIVENYHKGKLFIKESRVGKGTTFRIKLLAS